MAAKDTFCLQTLITKTRANEHAVSSGGQTGFGARGSASHASQEEGKDKKEICLMCRLGLRQGWLGWAIFSRVFRLSQKAAKKGKHFLQCPPRSPLPNLSTTRPSCAQHLATASLFRLLGTNIKFKDGATQVPSRVFLYFPTSSFVAIILHALRGNNLIQQSFVTFFVSFLTDVLRGSCLIFYPNNIHRHVLMCLPLRCILAYCLTQRQSKDCIYMIYFPPVALNCSNLTILFLTEMFS